MKGSYSVGPVRKSYLLYVRMVVNVEGTCHGLFKILISHLIIIKLNYHNRAPGRKLNPELPDYKLHNGIACYIRIVLTELNY
jgi:hypothetical protein